MNKFEFMLRHLWYCWLSERFDIDFNDDILLQLTQRTDDWKLVKKLTDTSPDELKELTLQTYTEFKKKFIEEEWKKMMSNGFDLGDMINRLEYEYKVIHEMWYDTYFLIVQDYILFSKKNWVVAWPWRWSAAGSLLSYLIRITEIDPMPYDLLFERFLNPARISMPDIDTDFEDTERDKILEYIKKKYGTSKVSQIWTYMTMAAKAAFKDVARVHGISFTKANILSNYIEKSISKTYDENEEFRQQIEQDSTLQRIVELASRLEWTVRQLWVHACGLIIAPEDAINYTPVQHPPKLWQKWELDANRTVSQYDWHVLEDIWLLKMDLLWLRNLTIIKNSIKIIKARLKLKWKELDDVYSKFFEYMAFEPPLDNADTYKLFQDWETSWIFQFESDGMRSWLKKLKPTSIDDVIAMVALYRPWPMEWIPNYIDRKNWTEKITYLPEDLYDTIKEKYWEDCAKEQKKNITADLSPFMDITYGIPVYQEQLLRIVQAMAWFSLGEADLLRRWVWKKIQAIIDKLKIEFIQRSNEYKGYKEEVSVFVYEKMIEPAADYSFNKSHAVCYAFIAYQTAYLKAHYPIEFHTALLRAVEENTEKMSLLIDELKIKWFRIVSPDVNTSFSHIAAVENSIVIWFLAVKWIWEDITIFIENEREKHWKFSTLEDFFTRCDQAINKKSLEALAKSWALDQFENRTVILNNCENILHWIKLMKQHKDTADMWLFWSDMIQADPLKLQKNDETISIMKNLSYEYETIGTFISGHPFDWLYSYCKRNWNFISQIQNEKYEWTFTILWFIKIIRKNMKTWCFWVTLEDISWTMDFYMKSLGNFKIYDIILLVWRKIKRLSINEIHKINLEKLVAKAKVNKKYNEAEKVYLVREKRVKINSDSKTTKKIVKKVENKPSSEETNISDTAQTVPDDNTPPTTIYTSIYKQVFLDLPDDMGQIQKIIKIKRQNIDKKEIEVDWDIFLLN